MVSISLARPGPLTSLGYKTLDPCSHFLQAGSHFPTSHNYINFALIAKFFFSLFNMVQIKFSAAFTLAAAAIALAPAVALPVSDIGLSRRSLDNASTTPTPHTQSVFVNICSIIIFWLMSRISVGPRAQSHPGPGLDPMESTHTVAIMGESNVQRP